MYGTLTDFRPAAETKVNSIGTAKKQIEAQKNSFSFLIWNIGYCGLGKDISFFYDGGSTVITPAPLVSTYKDGMKSYLKQQNSVDFILLQEVDLYSKRSHFAEEQKEIASVLPGYAYDIGVNYQVKYIPYPFYEPLGKVNSGLASFSPYPSSESIRYQFPGNYAWPKSIYFLDRCFLSQRYKLPSGKDLLVINTHNSAYDDGTLKARQMEFMKEKLVAEYEKGNYVVVGGDWNQTPPGFDNNTFKKAGTEAQPQIAIADDFLPGWTWAYDPKVPTNRKLDHPYDASKTFTTVIDFYLLSPNLVVDKIEGVDLDFQFSDHQPLYMEVSLK